MAVGCHKSFESISSDLHWEKESGGSEQEDPTALARLDIGESTPPPPPPDTHP